MIVEKKIEPSPNSLHHFEIAELTTYEPALLDPERDVADRFILAMAHAFNEMKLFYWALETFNDAPPDETKISGYTGQLSGMKNQVGRMVYACAHEVIKAVNMASNDRVFKDPIFKAAIESLRPDVKKEWQALVRSATSQENGLAEEFAFVLRNKLAFHYAYAAELSAGYTHHFLTKPKGDENAFAYASLGKNMENTRFFFADAAAQGASDLAGDADISDKGRALLGRINNTLRFLVESYLSQKQRAGAAPV